MVWNCCQSSSTTLNLGLFGHGSPGIAAIRAIIGYLSRPHNAPCGLVADVQQWVCDGIDHESGGLRLSKLQASSP